MAGGGGGVRVLETNVYTDKQTKLMGRGDKDRIRWLFAFHSYPDVRG